MFKLRGNQPEVVNKCLEVLKSPKKKSIVVAPTGYGKSLIIAKTVKELNEPIVILQPSKELLKQNYQKYLAFGGKASIYCSSLKKRSIKKQSYFELNGSLKRCDEISKVTFATIGSIKKDINKLKKLGIKHIIIDEVHSASKVGSQLRGFLKSLKVTNVLGVTATPIYLQGGLNGSRLVMINRSKSTIFRNIEHVTQIRELVDNKYWSPIKYKIIHNDESALKLNTSGADYTEFSQKEYYKSNGLKNQIVEEVKKLKEEGRKRILIFVPSIAEADELYGSIPNSAIVHSKMSREERDFMVESFSNGEIPVAINVNVLSIGYDNPEIDAIITARPTSSVALFYQQGGRGVRIHPNKKDVILTDFSGNVHRFGKIEDLTFEEIPHYGWGMFNGRGELLSDYPIMTKNKPTKESLIEAHKIKEKELKGLISKDKSVKFWFGKYEGKTIKEVLKEDKSYLIWMADEFSFNGKKGELLKNSLYKELQLPLK